MAMILSEWLEANHHQRPGIGSGRYSARDFLLRAEDGIVNGHMGGLFRMHVINRRCTWLTAGGLPCRLLGG